MNEKIIKVDDDTVDVKANIIEALGELKDYFDGKKKFSKVRDSFDEWDSWVEENIREGK